MWRGITDGGTVLLAGAERSKRREAAEQQLCGRITKFRDLARHHRGRPGSQGSKQVEHFAIRGAIPSDQSSLRAETRGSRAACRPCAVSLRRCGEGPENYGTNLRIARASQVIAHIYLRTIESSVACGLVSQPSKGRDVQGHKPAISSMCCR